MNTPSEKTDPSNRSVTTYQEARLQHADLLRQNVIEAAAILLQESGPEGVTIRRIAERMECSTKIIYNLFGSKEALAKQLFLEGCKLLSQTFEAVSKQADHEQNIKNLAAAYWSFGQFHTSFYKIMFGGAFTEFKPDEESFQGMITALRQVLYVVEDAMSKGFIAEKDPLLAVRMIWAPLHGVIHLYLGGHIESVTTAEALYNHVLAAAIQSLFETGKIN